MLIDEIRKTPLKKVKASSLSPGRKPKYKSGSEKVVVSVTLPKGLIDKMVVISGFPSRSSYFKFLIHNHVKSLKKGGEVS